MKCRISIVTNSIWNIKKGEKLFILSKERYRNSEYEVKTNKGWIPSIFLAENK